MKNNLIADIEREFSYINYWGIVFNTSQDNYLNYSGDNLFNDLVALAKEKKKKPIKVFITTLSDGSFSGQYKVWRSYLEEILANVMFDGVPILEGGFNINLPAPLLIDFDTSVPLPLRFGIVPTIAGLPRVSFPKNRYVKYTYNKRSLMLPAFYDAPYEEITEEQAREIGQKCGWSHFTLAQAESSRRNVPLGFMTEDENTIYVHLLSLAGLYFLSDFILDYIGATRDELNKMASSRVMKKLAKKVLDSRTKNIEVAKKDIKTITENLTRAHRNLYTLERMKKEKDLVKIYEEELKRIKSQCEKDKQIQALWFNQSGAPFAILGALTLTIYMQDYEFVDSQHYNKDEGEKIETPLGYVLADLQRERFYSLHRSETIQEDNVPLHHPHIDSGNAELCLGNAESLYSQLIGKLDLVGAIRLALTLLQKYNPESPVSEIEDVDDFQGELEARGVTEEAIKKYKINRRQIPKDAEIIYLREDK